MSLDIPRGKSHGKELEPVSQGRSSREEDIRVGSGRVTGSHHSDKDLTSQPPLAPFFLPRLSTPGEPRPGLPSPGFP
uniref:Uncharacterized protein n=1 Tax=Mustela putorius furo TaxID=9669 RepID=M3Y541_MUSPF